MLGKVLLYVCWFPQRACDRCYKLSSVLRITIVELNNYYDIICFFKLNIFESYQTTNNTTPICEWITFEIILSWCLGVLTLNIYNSK